MEESVTSFTYAEPIKVRVEHGKTGGVGWEISIHGNDPDVILAQIACITAKIREQELTPHYKKEVE